MSKLTFIILAVLLIAGCSGTSPVSNEVIAPDLQSWNEPQLPFNYIPWGYYDIQIERDGSSAEVLPNRTAMSLYGYHLNAVKLLETAPCTNCLWLSNIHLLPNGDVSVDISIKHPYYDRRYTAFDVMGIIMFPASQYWPDNNLRELKGLSPANKFVARFSNRFYGDAELMNPDGWTEAWHVPLDKNEFSLIQWNPTVFLPDDLKDYPIFKYYPGKFTSGENLSTISAFKRYHSTETRHMFEVGKTVTRTFIIRPPADGPIKAGYAVYAHWYPPDKVPVTNPAIDFPPRANSPLPYEFYITQDGLLDPDDPNVVLKVHWHVKTWDIGYNYWRSTTSNPVSGAGCGSGILPHPNGEQNVYYGFAHCYFDDYPPFPGEFPDNLPDSWFIICNWSVRNPADDPSTYQIGSAKYLIRFDYAPLDGEY